MARKKKKLVMNNADNISIVREIDSIFIHGAMAVIKPTKFTQLITPTNIKFFFHFCLSNGT